MDSARESSPHGGAGIRRRTVLAVLALLAGAAVALLLLRGRGGEEAGEARSGDAPGGAPRAVPGGAPPGATTAAPTLSHVRRSGPLAERVHVTFPEPGRRVFRPLVVVGWAPGGWYFEATFPLHLAGPSGAAVADSFATAEGAWMTPEQVPFRGALRVRRAAEGPATLVVRRANASGLPEHDAEVRSPIRLGGDAVPRVYFPNSILDPRATDCARVFPVARDVVVPPAREISGAPEAARELVAQLLAGPRPAELEAGYHTALPEAAGLRSVTIVDGTLKVDFDAGLARGVGGSCRVLAIRAQVDSTLARLPGVERVEISVEGRTEGVLRP